MATVISELINIIGFKVNKGEARKVEKTFESILDKAQNVGRKLSLAVTLPFIALSAASIKAASDVVETQNRFNQVFGTLSTDAEKFSKDLADRLRRSEFQIKDNLSALQSFGVGMGFTRKEAFKFSQEMQKLIFDFASFNNISDQDAFRRFIAGLSGSGEVFDTFGIQIKEGALNVELLTSGLAGSVQKATELQKVIGRASIIRKTLGKQGAIGDAERTMRDFAGAMKSALAAVKLLLANFGKELLPIATKIVNKFNDLFFTFKDKLTPTIKRFIIIAGFLAAAIGPLILGSTLFIQALLFMKGAFLAVAAGAATANLPIALFLAKIALIGIAVAAVIGLLGLIIEDILVFQRGGNSAIGAIVDKFNEWKEQLMDLGIFIPQLFADIVGDIRDSLDGLIEFLVGIFTLRFKFAFSGLANFIKSTFAAVFNAILLPFQAIFDIINQVTGSKIQLLNASGVATDLTNQFSNFTNGFDQGLLQTGRSLTGQSLNINSTVNLSFPASVDQALIDSADQQMRKAIRDEMSTQINNAVNANPEVE